jgi:hypothetical protein
MLARWRRRQGSVLTEYSHIGTEMSHSRHVEWDISFTIQEQ